MPETPLEDLFIDTNIAKNFHNPIDPVYQKLNKWLREDEQAGWVVSQKLLVEYGRTNQNIAVLVDFLLKKKRLIKITVQEHEAFKIPKRLENKLTCNTEDRYHLKTILLSSRKMALIIDKAFRKDVNKYPKIDGVKPVAEERPENLPYAL